MTLEEAQWPASQPGCFTQAKFPRDSLNRRLVAPSKLSCSSRDYTIVSAADIYKAEVKEEDNWNGETEEGLVEIFPVNRTGCWKLSGTATEKK